MINLRSPVNILLPRVVHYLKYSSDGPSENVHQEILKINTNQDKIITDEFRNLLPYLRDRDNKLEDFTITKKIFNFTESEFSSDDDSETQNTREQNMKELTNIFDKTPDVKKLVQDGPSTTTGVEDSSFKNSSKDPEAIPEPPKSLGVVIVTDPEKSKIKLSKDRDMDDLASTLLPLALHDKDVRYNLLKTAIAQDVHNMYWKATKTAHFLYARASIGGTHLYNMAMQSNSLQVLAKQGSVALTIWRDKTAIWLSDATKPTSESPGTGVKIDKADPTTVAIEKIRRTIESVVANLKRRIEERKKGREEKK